MRLAMVDARGGRLFVRTSCWTDQGAWVQQGPCTTLSEDAAVDEIGAAVLSALARSKQIPHPTSWGGGFSEVLRAAGVRSWSAFVKGALSVEVEQRDDDSFRLVPTRNRGAKEGFEGVPDQAIDLPRSANATELGESVLASLARSRTLSSQ